MFPFSTATKAGRRCICKARRVVERYYSGLGIMIDTTETDDTFIVQMNNDQLIFTTTLFRL